MGIEFTLIIKGEYSTLEKIEKIFENMDIKVTNAETIAKGFLINSFFPNIGMQVSLLRKDNYPKNHPGYIYKTEFLREGLPYTEKIFFEFDKFFGDVTIQYKTMFNVIESIFKKSNYIAMLVATNGEEIFFYKYGKYYFTPYFYGFLETNYYDLLNKLDCCQFNGNYLD